MVVTTYFQFHSLSPLYRVSYLPHFPAVRVLHDFGGNVLCIDTEGMKLSGTGVESIFSPPPSLPPPLPVPTGTVCAGHIHRSLPCLHLGPLSQSLSSQ